MSLYQFTACVDGWNKAHGPEDKPEAPTPEEFRDMVERLG